MSRIKLLLISLLVFACAITGLWIEGARDQFAIHAALKQLHYPATYPVLRGPDSIYWVAYTRWMIDTGNCKARFTHLDNAPFGRLNLGWAALTSWHLEGVAKLWSLATGKPLREALLPASEWANPALLLVVLALVLIIGARRKSFLAAGIAALTLCSVPRTYFDFGFAMPDHHGWHDLAALVFLTSLAAAIRRPEYSWRFALAGITAGTALWVGATQQVVIIATASVGVTIGLLSVAVLKKHGTDAPTLPLPENWRWFGIAGALTSFGFYIFEFAPGFTGMHLEVNHPFYSFALFIGGEFLCRLQRILFAPDQNYRKAPEIAVGLACISTLACMAALAMFGPVDWHVMHLPFIKRVHQEIAEFQPLLAHEGLVSLPELGMPLFFSALAIVACCARKTSAQNRIALFAMLLPCFACISATALQLRWAGLAAVCAASIAITLFSPRTTAGEGANQPSFLNGSLLQASCLILSVLFFSFWVLFRPDESAAALKSGTIDVIANVDIAKVINEDCAVRKQPPIALYLGLDPHEAWLACFGGISSVGSLYWDNLEGLRDQVTFFTNEDIEASHQMALRRKVTHVIVSDDAPAIVAYHYLATGNRNMDEIRKSLGYQIAHPTTPTVPNWLQLVTETTPAIQTAGIRIYRVIN